MSSTLLARTAPEEPTGARHPHRSLAYQPALDGLRGVAVLLVMLYHAGVAHLHGGFLGVDVFFVLSGYLITTLLLGEHVRWRHVDLRLFWLRRARRLLPALFVMLAVVGLAAPLYASAERLGLLRGDGLATLAYVANWRFIATGQSYFDQFADPSPFRHMWSLGIEEQWYWLFPLTLVLAVRLLRRRRRVLAVFAAATLASALWMAHLAGVQPDFSRVYYSTWTRAQELLVGTVLAIAMFQMTPRGRGQSGWSTRNVVGALGAMVAVAIVVLAWDNSAWLYRGGFLAFCLAVAAVIPAVLDSTSTGARMLAWRPLVAVGTISYGLYLWHWPTFLLLTPERLALAPVPLFLLRFVVTGLIAWASYVWLERPIRSGWLARRFGPRTVRMLFVAAVAAVVACLFVGTRGATQPPRIERSGTFETKVVASEIGQRRLLLLGDSPGRFLSWYAPRDLLDDFAISASTVLGCGLLPQNIVVDGRSTPEQPQCDQWVSEWERAAGEVKPDVVLLSTGFWELYDKRVDGTVLKVGSPEFAAALTQRLDQVRDLATRGHVPLVMLNVPCMQHGPYVVAGVDLAKNPNDPVRQAAVNDVLGDFAQRHPDVHLLDYRSFLCRDGEYVDTVDGVQARPDGVHLGGPGGRLVGKWLAPQLRDIVAEEARAKVLMVGDSVTASLVDGFDPRSNEGLTAWKTTHIGCGLDPLTKSVSGRVEPDLPECVDARQRWPSLAAGLDPDVAVVLPGIGELYDRVIEGRTVAFGSAEYRRDLFAQLDRAFADAHGRSAVLMTHPCSRLADRGTNENLTVFNDPRRTLTLNAMLRDYAQSRPGVHIVDLYGYLCAQGYRETLEGVQLRSDGLHFTKEGAALIWEWLRPQLTEVARSSRKD